MWDFQQALKKKPNHYRFQSKNIIIDTKKIKIYKQRNNFNLN